MCFAGDFLCMYSVKSTVFYCGIYCNLISKFTFNLHLMYFKNDFVEYKVNKIAAYSVFDKSFTCMQETSRE